MADTTTTTATRVCYIHSPSLLAASELNPRVGNRPTVVHSLIEALGLLNHMSIIPPPSESDKGLLLFHSSDYVKFINDRDQTITTNDITDNDDEEYGIGFDCPSFSGIYSYACNITAASLQAAQCIISGEYHISINWYGGRHHGQRDKASGFCYCNDVVVCILQLLQTFSRVLYIDIDVHHGDGVEQAFYYSDRVVTLSFHKFSPGYFPGSGSIESIGSGNGIYYTINVPLEDGVTDEQYTSLFNSILSKLAPKFKPSVIVFQCGADCLATDPLGGFNLTLQGVGHCMNTVLNLQLPTIILGGGGYNFANTARLWSYLTSIIIEQTISSTDIPEHKYFDLYRPGYQLMIDQGTRLNRNTILTISKTLQQIQTNISLINIY